MTEVHVYIANLSAGVASYWPLEEESKLEAQLILADEDHEDTAILIHTTLAGLHEIRDAISSHLEAS